MYSKTIDLVLSGGFYSVFVLAGLLPTTARFVDVVVNAELPAGNVCPPVTVERRLEQQACLRHRRRGTDAT